MYLLALKNRCQKVILCELEYEQKPRNCDTSHGKENETVSTYDFPNEFLFMFFVCRILIVKPYSAHFAGTETERIIISLLTINHR
jgi:hypothetical protein